MENSKKGCFEHEICTGDCKWQQYSFIGLWRQGLGHV